MIVVVAVTEKQVIVTDQFNAAPVTGRQAIFNKVSAPTEIKPVIEVVGVYSTLEMAEQGRIQHHAGNPQCRYVQKVCALDVLGEPPAPAVCIMCGTATDGGLSYCPPCNEKRAAQLRDSDPELLKEIAAASR